MKKCIIILSIGMYIPTCLFAQCPGTDAPCPSSSSTPSNLGTVTTGLFCSTLSSCANGHGDGSATTFSQSYSTTYGGAGKCLVTDGTGNDIWFRFTMPASTDKCNLDIYYSGCGTVTGRAMIYGPNPNCTSYPSIPIYCVTWTSSTGISDLLTGLTGGSTYHLRLLFEGTTCSNIDVCLYKASGTSPIELLSFTAFPYSEKEVKISWATATEENNNYFTIERSIDGVSFLPICTVKGAGNSSTQRKYSFVDSDPIIGTSYYRLKQTDYDGKFEIFNPVSVNFDPNNIEWIFVNPNVVSSSDKINLELTDLPSGNDIIICLYDLNGNTVYSKIFRLDINGKGLITTLDLPHNLPPGMYALRVLCENRMGCKKIIIR